MNFKKRMEEVTELSLECGLDPFPVVFETVEKTTMNNIASYGLPCRARHWSYGRSYDHQKTYGKMGYSKLYEIILNNNPSYAFMLDTNTDIQNLFINAHCQGHSDYFKNNYLFQNTNRNMIHHSAEHAGRIEEYIEKYGFDKVEHLMDIGFSLDDHIDWHKGMYRKLYDKKKISIQYKTPQEFDDLKSEKPKYIRKVIENENFPPHPEKDLLWFFINYAPLEDWEKDVLDIIREEAFYFYPQRLTKIANEGWACVCPDQMMFIPSIGLVSAQDVYKNKMGFVIDKDNKKQKINDFHTSRKFCRKIKTARGYELSGARNHKIITSTDGNKVWKELEELEIGDLIEIKHSQKCFGKSQKVFGMPLNEKMAKFLGYFSSSGQIINNSIYFNITNDEDLVREIPIIIRKLFKLEIDIEYCEGVYRVSFESEELCNLLKELKAEILILREILLSPENIMRAFLYYFLSSDLSTASEEKIKDINLIALNFGLVRELSNNLEHLNADYILDQVIEISDPFVSDVIDFEVDKTHSYQAQGFVNHNSYWHTEIMYQYDNLTAQEFLEFANTHEKVVQPGGNPFRINPYFLGFKIFKDIEKRWDKSHGKGQGKTKIFQVMKEEDDISFLRNYLTTDLVEELGLFTYGYSKVYGENYSGEKLIEIKTRMKDEIVELLTSPLYNCGVPQIFITGVSSDGNLILKHQGERTLNYNFAKKTLEYVWELWTAPVELHLKSEKNEHIVMSFDEAGYHLRSVEKDFDF